MGNQTCTDHLRATTPVYSAEWGDTCFTLELFAGSAGITAAMVGLSASFGINFLVPSRTSPAIGLDLSLKASQQLIFPDSQLRSISFRVDGAALWFYVAYKGDRAEQCSAWLPASEVSALFAGGTGCTSGVPTLGANVQALFDIISCSLDAP